MDMEIQLAVAKVVKYGSLESGDTLEIVERPMGGVSCVLADARSSGASAKSDQLNFRWSTGWSCRKSGIRFPFYGKRWDM